ncbi:metallo-beta-lactamase superfamily protein [Nitzschia inconspicua]|uniref:Cleavage and polyadenylation specificity factor subunit 2 n=1 Tax=Nitzschia inconspicua TaxID=303405 RepID=A0A9K3LCQ8_9STRA|nr:metallo-beta-lactamase superfamily protein [Nitzschia inconspicua]
MLRITPLYGSRWEEAGAAKRGSCTLVEYADVRVLVNVGLRVDDDAAGTVLDSRRSAAVDPPNFPTPESASSFWENLPPHDCLVLTESSLECIGSLPLYVKGVSRQTQRELQLPLDDKNATFLPPIYATFPTVKMGQMSLYDYHANLCLDGAKPPFSLEEIDAAFAQLRTIKYSQTLLLPVSLTSAPNSMASSSLAPRLAVTAQRAGHVVGGAFLVLERLQDETTVVFTSTYHIAKEVHLESSTLLKYGATPDVLVTRPGGPACPLIGQLYQQNVLPRTPLVTQAQRNLTNHVLNILRRDGNVLLPIDASGRALELLLIFQRFWDRQRLAGSYNLVWMGHMAYNTLDFARSQLEWMNADLGNQFDNSQRSGGGGGHPYALRDVQICTNMSELEKIIANGDPTCVLASGMTLDHGPARDLLLRWGDNDNNAIVFTDSSQCCQRRQQKEDPIGTSGTHGLHSMGSRNAAVVATSRETTKGIMAPEEVVTAAAQEAGLIGSGTEGDEGDEDVGLAISVEDASAYTTAFQLLQYWCQAKLEDREMEDSVEVDVLVPKRRPLAGPELQQFLEEEESARRAQRRKEEEEAMLREVELAKGRLRLGEDVKVGHSSVVGGSSVNGVEAPTGLSSVSNLPFARPKKKSRFDSSLFLKFSKPLHLTFEVREDAVGLGQRDQTAKFGIGESIESSEVVEDDYGISVVPDHFVDIVTGVDSSKFAAGSGRIGDEVMRRGLGYGASGGDDTGKKRGAAEENEENEDVELDERGMEAADLSEGRGIIRGRNGRPPIRITNVNRRFQVFAEIDYIPLEGRVDAQAARQSVRALQPRQVVVLGGTKETKIEIEMKDKPAKRAKSLLETDEVQILADAARGFITTDNEVLTPFDGEMVELKVGHAAYSARLIATPYRTQEEKEKDETPVEPIELHETKIGDCIVSLLDYVATGQRVALDGSVVLAPKKKSSKLPAVYVSDGEVLLTDLRTELIAQGMKAEYSSHSGYSQLIVNGRIIVKKMSNTGKIDLEGPLCEDFFTVRSIVCNQYVVL